MTDGWFNRVLTHWLVYATSAYVVLAWLIVQLVEIAVPVFGWPASVVSFAWIGAITGLLPSLEIVWISR